MVTTRGGANTNNVNEEVRDEQAHEARANESEEMPAWMRAPTGRRSGAPPVLPRIHRSSYARGENRGKVPEVRNQSRPMPSMARGRGQANNPFWLGQGSLGNSTVPRENINTTYTEAARARQPPQQDQQQQQHQGIPLVNLEAQDRMRMAYDRPIDWVEKVRKYKVPNFYGDVDSAQADLWIRGFEKACRSMKAPASEWAQTAVALLMGNAEFWMDSYELTHGKVTDWNTFKEQFYREFFPKTAQNAKAKEFLDLNQGLNMTVTQYAHKFNELGRFYP